MNLSCSYIIYTFLIVNKDYVISGLKTEQQVFTDQFFKYHLLICHKNILKSIELETLLTYITLHTSVAFFFFFLAMLYTDQILMNLQLNIRYICKNSLQCSLTCILDLSSWNKSVKTKGTKYMHQYTEEFC